MEKIAKYISDRDGVSYQMALCQMKFIEATMLPLMKASMFKEADEFFFRFVGVKAKDILHEMERFYVESRGV